MVIFVFGDNVWTALCHRKIQLFHNSDDNWTDIFHSERNDVPDLNCGSWKQGQRNSPIEQYHSLKCKVKCYSTSIFLWIFFLISHGASDDFNWSKQTVSNLMPQISFTKRLPFVGHERYELVNTSVCKTEAVCSVHFLVKVSFLALLAGAFIRTRTRTHRHGLAHKQIKQTLTHKFYLFVCLTPILANTSRSCTTLKGLQMSCESIHSLPWCKVDQYVQRIMTLFSYRGGLHVYLLS